MAIPIKAESPLNDCALSRWVSCLGSVGLALLSSTPLQAQPLPVPYPMPKLGSCPVGYYSSGDYCQPGSQARPAIAKVGSCPVGWYSSGNYCLAGGSARAVIIKSGGSCPVGSYSSGNYCVLNRRE